MPRKIFVAGEILTAADVNTNLMDQAVMVFDDDAARATAIPTPVEGMVTYLKDTDSVEVFDGSDFVPVAIEPDPPAILQVVSAVKTDVFTTASNLYVDVPGLSATITPSSASNKILVSVALPAGNTESGGGNMVTVTDGDNNNLIVPDSPGSRTPAGSAELTSPNQASSHPFFLFHTPAVTTAFTYKVRVRNMAGTATFNRSGSDDNSPARPRTIATITLMEVAG